MTSSPLRIALTPGEPAGIGPDLAIQIAQKTQAYEVVCVASSELLRQRAQHLGLELQLKPFVAEEEPRASAAGELSVIDVALQAAVTPGSLAAENANYVLETLRLAANHCIQGSMAAVVTGPVQKSVINDAGIPFSGHTEFFAEQSKTKRVVMMLATEGLRVSLATTHLPLREVANAITPEGLEEVIRILHHDLRGKFGLSSPKILVCGLNPHAGEGGHLGSEEIEIISPTLEKLRGQGMNLIGPLPADTLFTDKNLNNCDAVLAMYHDQGLPVLKHKGFGQAVNITLGLPFIRTSVDHGTALELAGSGRANSGSMLLALDYAQQMAEAANRIL